MTGGAQLARRGRYTVDDWEQLDESTWPRVELINGEFTVSPAPSRAHQVVVDELWLVLRTAIRSAGKSRELYAVTGVNVVLAPPHGYIPDVAVLDTLENRTFFPAENLVLAVEVVSPRSVKEDRLTKPAAYAAAGVPFYWRIEGVGDGRPTVVTHRLSGGIYVEHLALKSGNEATITTEASPIEVTLDPAGLLPY